MPSALIIDLSEMGANQVFQRTIAANGQGN
jgi:hypothetical protein